MAFLPLHVYTGYSILKSGLLLPAFLSSAKNRGQTHCAISDFESLIGFPELAEGCQKLGMIPVFGLDAEADGHLFTLVVQTEEGYRNAIEIALCASKLELDLVFLRHHQKGLTFILCLDKPQYAEELKAGEEFFASTLFSLSQGIDDFCLGLPYLPLGQDKTNLFRDFVRTHPYPLLAHPLIRYLKPDDAISLAIVEAISDDKTLEQTSLSGDEWYLDDATLSGFFTPEELSLPETIARKSTFVFSQKRGALPLFPSDDGLPSAQALRRNAYEGLYRKIPNAGKEYIDRLEYELSVIERMGYCDYFLIVADYVNYAKTHGISVGPGRGSAAGSLVSFSLGIVSPDPLKYGLLFERFLNPERQTMPDIDVDFADVRRDEVCRYLQEKYGHERVAHIVTMQTLGAKASIRDVGRVFGFRDRTIEDLCKSIGGNTQSLRDNYRTNTAFRTLVDSDSYYLKIVTLAVKIEGLPRQTGLHAAGMVLSQKPLKEVVPIAEHPEVGYVAQYEMTHLEEQGVLKMDILGLRNLTLIDHCIDLVEATHGIRLDYATIPYEDDDAIRLIREGQTMGLFQLESEGMNNAIATVLPTTFTDVVAIIALFRPGPMANIPSFARRKAGKERITYPHPSLEPFLRETYGIMVYQEQIVQIVTALAGYSYGQADLFRRAVSKKDAEKLESLKGGFLEGCIARGVPQKTALEVYDLIFRFADYGFNKSHALVYGILACQMAYLKSRYPAEFYCAILDGKSPSDPKFLPLASEIKARGYRFLLPNINQATNIFLPKENGIMFPLGYIKGIPDALVARLVDERTQNGPYKDIFDLAARNKGNGLTTALLVKLIDAGALDSFGVSRPRLRLAADSAIRYAQMLSGLSGNQILLDFGFPKPDIPDLPDDRMGDLMAERDVLGIMISGSALESKADVIEQEHLLRLRDLPNLTYQGKYAGVIAKVSKITTKKGTRMAFLTLYDEDSFVEAAMFSDAYDASFAQLKEGNLVKATIRKNQGRKGYVCTLVELL